MGDQEEVYQGESVVRGINAESWRRTFVNHTLFGPEPMNFTADIYFAKADWELRGDEFQRIPLRIHVQGVRKNGTTFDNFYETVPPKCPECSSAVGPAFL